MRVDRSRRRLVVAVASLVASCIGLFVPMVHLGPYAQDHGYTAAEGVTLVSLLTIDDLTAIPTCG